MTKRSRPIEIDESPPVGDITDANPPLPIRVRVIWGFLGPTVINDAWAMAWTRQQVLVFWRTPGEEKPITVWVRSDQVRRR